MNIHELGSPARNIPARPHLVPGVTDALPEIEKYMREAALGAINGDLTAIDAGFEKAGIAGVRGVTRKIQAGLLPPLAESTIARRRNRGTGSTYRRRARTAAEVTPLIDTGKYLAAFAWVIRDS